MIAISPAHNAFRLEGSRAALLAGAGQPQILLYDGVQPGPGEAGAGQLIATAVVADATMVAGVLVLTPTPAPVIVMTSGTPTWARVLDAAGGWWMDGDASELDGAFVKLATPGPYLYGGRIVVDSVVIA